MFLGWRPLQVFDRAFVALKSYCELLDKGRAVLISTFVEEELSVV